VLVRGFVQGVGFRYAVLDRARSRRLGGWVRNRKDGAVEAVFEGEPDAVDALVCYCQRGPRGAEVEGVEVVDEEPEGLQGFEVRF
jgi:acylphosphatase